MHANYYNATDSNKNTIFFEIVNPFRNARYRDTKPNSFWLGLSMDEIVVFIFSFAFAERTELPQPPQS